MECSPWSKPMQPRWKPDWIKLPTFFTCPMRSHRERGYIHCYPGGGRVQGVQQLLCDTTKAGVDAYIVRFIDYRKKVAKYFPVLDLSETLVPVEEEEETKQETTGIDEAIRWLWLETLRKLLPCLKFRLRVFSFSFCTPLLHILGIRFL